jgi:hypothetical protein
METAVRDDTAHFVERRRPGSRPPLGAVFVERRRPRPVAILELDDLHADDVDAVLGDDLAYGFGPSPTDRALATVLLVDLITRSPGPALEAHDLTD